MYRLLSFEEIERNVIFASRMFSASANKSVILGWAQMETSTGKTALKAAYSCASSAFSFWRHCCLSCYCFLSIYSVLFSFWARCGIPRSYSIRKKGLWDLLFWMQLKRVGILLHWSMNPVPKLITLEIHFHFIRKRGKSLRKRNFNLKTMSKNQ